MIPYVHLPDLTLASADAFGPGWPEQDVAIRPFGTLVAIAVLWGVWLSVSQAKRLGLSQTALVGFLYWIVLGGFVGGHVLDIAFYHPELVIEQPWLVLNLASGQSSFGGFIGATLGAWIWSSSGKHRLAPFAEVVASSFPAAWVIGRLGCAIAHDHPGIRVDRWFAVAFPGGARLDLGLMEAVLVIPLAVLALRLRQRPRPTGFFAALMCVYYAPLRFTLDMFRARDVSGADARYAGLTPAQWGSILLFGAGVYFSSRAWLDCRRTLVREPAPSGADGLEVAQRACPTLAGTGKSGESKRTT